MKLALPIIQAPMAAGPDSPALAAAVSNAGGLGSLGCAYFPAAKIESPAAEPPRPPEKPSALTLFPRADRPADPSAAARVLPLLRDFRRELALADEPPLPPPLESFEAQFEAVLR